ncbi:MAG: recombinase family protein [Ruminococcaceae bacterium]|nr:recombinase family protein [Oscillospiraceae bacterium]
MPKRKVTQVEFAPRLGDFGRAPTAKLRVAAYARVSTEKEEQEHSPEAQTDYFENYIKENPRWEFVGLYVDDGISGLSYHNREGFFEKENIWTFDSKGELLLTIMSSLAQEESRSISENITWGKRKQFADGLCSPLQTAARRR